MKCIYTGKETDLKWKNKPVDKDHLQKAKDLHAEEYKRWLEEKQSALNNPAYTGYTSHTVRLQMAEKHGHLKRPLTLRQCLEKNKVA